MVEVVKGEEVPLRRDDPPITKSVITAGGSPAEQNPVRLKVARVQAVLLIRYREYTGYV